jgi:hypothetical protein
LETDVVQEDQIFKTQGITHGIIKMERLLDALHILTGESCLSTIIPSGIHLTMEAEQAKETPPSSASQEQQAATGEIS